MITRMRTRLASDLLSLLWAGWDVVVIAPNATGAGINAPVAMAGVVLDNRAFVDRLAVVGTFDLSLLAVMISVVATPAD